MKKLIAFIALLILANNCLAQNTLYLRNDTVSVEKTTGTGNAELKIKNATRAITGGFLQNELNGKTKFKIPVISDVTGLQADLDLKAPLASPTFTGTVSGITKSMVGLSNVDNTTDLLKPVSRATQDSLDIGRNFFSKKGKISIASFGDSYTVGTGATNSSYAYINIFANRLDATVSNQGASGGGVVEMFKRSINVLSANNSIPITALAGFNDAIRGGSDIRELEKIKGGYLAFLANVFLTTSIPASSESVTQTGTWVALNGSTNFPLKAETISGTGLSNSSIGAKLSYTFSGSSLVVGYVSNDATDTGFQMASFNIVIDGVAMGTYTGNNKTLGVVDSFWSNDYAPNAEVFTNLGTGSHTVEVINNDGNALYIDYFGTLLPPSQCANVLIGTIPKIDSAGYAGRPYSPSDITTDSCSSYIVEATKIFINGGYPVSLIDVNRYYNSDGIAVDNVHPNDIGHGQLATAFISKIATASFENLGDIEPTTISIAGSTPVAGTAYYDAQNISGATTLSRHHLNGSIQSTVTSNVFGYRSTLGTAAASFTLGGLSHFYVSGGTIGAGSTVTNQFGFRVESTMTGGGQNFAYTASLPVATGRWNIYSNGTAQNYFAGNVGFKTLLPLAYLHIGAGTATAGTAPILLTSGTNLTTAVAGAIEYNGTSLFFSPSTTRLRTVLTDNTIPANGQLAIGNGVNYTNALPTGTQGVSVTPGAGALAIGLGAITPTSVNGITLSGASTPTLAVTGTTTVSGANTGDQTNITGNAGTVTTNANLTGDVTSVGNATTIAAGAIVDADINAGAAISGSKIVSANTSTTGVLTSTDWNTFNDKAPASGSANYAQIGRSTPQTGNIFITGSVFGNAGGSTYPQYTLSPTGLTFKSDSTTGKATYKHDRISRIGYGIDLLFPVTGGTLATEHTTLAGYGITDKVPVALFDHYTTTGNVTTAETDLSSYTIAAGRLANNGDKIIAKYGGNLTSATSTTNINLYFGGTVIYSTDPTTVGIGTNWEMEATIIRVSTTDIRVLVKTTLGNSGTFNVSNITNQRTGFDVANSNILKVTATASGSSPATNDIQLILGTGEFKPAAQ